MAIRNTNLGGTDWGNEGLTFTDLNDTFDAAVTKIQSLSAFWLNSDLYDDYENFDSESTGSFTGNTKVTINTNAATGWTVQASITNTQNAGGATNELRLHADHDGGTGADGAYTEVEATALAENKHTFGALYGFASSDVADAFKYQISIDGSTYYDFGEVNDRPDDIWFLTNFLVIAKGSNQYDLYVGRKQLASSVTVADLKVYIRIYASQSEGSAAAASYDLYIDDIRQSKSTIS